MDQAVLFDGPNDLIRIAATAPIMYVSVVLAIRLAGKRATSQMNNFDWIVTVAVGSLVGSGIILEDVTASEAILGILILLGLQWVVTKLAVHQTWVQRVVKAQPALLIEDGQVKEKTMRRERVTEAELFAALRRSGLTDPAQAVWVVLESDATLSVIPEGHDADRYAAVEDIARPRSMD